MKISRRSFLKSSAATTAAMALPGQIASTVLAAQPSPSLTPGPGNKWPGRIVINYNKKAIQGTSNIVPAEVVTMVNEAILLLTKETTLGAAWKAIFPSTLTAQSKIAIKVYCANTSIPTHWQSVKAITDGLQQMDFSGAKIPAGNIAIYEGNAGNNLSAAGFTTGNFPGITIEYWTASKFVDGSGNEAAGSIKDRAYCGNLKNADFLINVFNPHGHETKYGSFSLGFKNHYGTYHLTKPTDVHTGPEPHLRDMNCTGPIFKKTVLSVCSGMVALNEGNGPFGSPEDFSKYGKTVDPTSTCKCPATIIMSTDPISCEMQTIKMMRLNKGGNYGVNDMPKYLQASAGVSGALSGTIYNIGIIDETQMDIRRIINGTSSITRHPLPAKDQSPISLVASPMPGRASTFIEYRLPAQHIGQKASIEIYSLKGALVRRQSQAVFGAVNHFAWDNKDNSGRAAGAGRYVVRLTLGDVALSEHFTIR